MDDEKREDDIEQTPPEPGRRRSREKIDKLDVALFLLRRNLRYIIGFILLLGIGGWIYFATVNPRQPKSRGTWTKTILPTADIDSPPTRSVRIEDPSIEAEPETRSNKLEYFLARATINELIEDALDHRERWANTSLPIAYILVQRRAKIARRLLEMEINEEQRIFAYNEYIESVATLDGLNCEGKMGAPGIRGALKEIGEKFSDFPDPVIGSKASLVFLLEHAHDYLETNDTKCMLAFAEKFDVYADNIMRDPVTTMQLAKLIVDIHKKSNFNDVVKQSGIKILNRLEKNQDEEFVEIARELREQMYFAKMELGSLVDRLESDDENARQDVQDFFESLEINPSSRLEIYQIAVNSVVEYKRLKMTKEATALTNWLEAINSKNESEEAKEKIAKAIAVLKN